jgi:hypothetical protein
MEFQIATSDFEFGAGNRLCCDSEKEFIFALKYGVAGYTRAS